MGRSMLLVGELEDALGTAPRPSVTEVRAQVSRHKGEGMT